MKHKVALITGITGQDGSYLAELLLEKGYKVHGIARRSSTFNRGRIEHLFTDVKMKAQNIVIHYGDMSDSNSLLRILLEVKPDEIYNLAAQSHVGISFETPEYTADVTAVGTTRLLEALRTSKLQSKFYQASSSEMFGKVVETPQSETTPFYPRSPYACAKVYSYFLTKNYRESYNMFACNGILFNHESPRRGENFVTRKITLSLANIFAGKQDCLFLGNLDAKRDWGHAKDYVHGMWLMLQQETAKDYVLATGETHSVRDFLELCLQYANVPFRTIGTGLDEKYIDTNTNKVIVAISSEYYRPSEVDLLLGDPTKAKNELGWKHEISFNELVFSMLQSDFHSMNLTLPTSQF